MLVLCDLFLNMKYHFRDKRAVFFLSCDTDNFNHVQQSVKFRTYVCPFIDPLSTWRLHDLYIILDLFLLSIYPHMK